MAFGHELRMAAEEFTAAPGLVLLTAFLLHEGAAGAHCNSFYAPYFHVLPKKLSSLPVCWPDDHWLHSTIKGSHLERQVRAKRHNLGLEFALLKSYVGKLPLTWEDFLWARCIVSSRAYSLQSQRCLVPWADLLNHGTSSEVCVRYGLEGETASDFVMNLGQLVPQGAELLQSYGDKPNATLLLDYGFVLPQAPPAVVSLAFQLPQLLETDPALKEKKVFWTRVSKGRSFRKGELLLEVDEAAEAFLELLRAAVVCGQPQGSSCDLEEKLQDPSVEMEALIRLQHSAQQALGKLCEFEGPEVKEDWEVVSQQNCAQALADERCVLQSLVARAKRES
ncbi:unnamed protein product [Durusdinium trenchii]